MQIQTLQKINGCVSDIFVDPSSKTASFSEVHYALKKLKKQFPKVEELYIGENVKQLELSNFLFPNVKRVVSESSYFLSSEQGILCHAYYHDLLNTFCKEEDTILDLTGVRWISPGAMQGCRTTHIENLCDSVLMDSRYGGSEREWNGSAFLLRQSYQEALKKNGFLKCGPIIIALDERTPEIKLTGPISDISRDVLHYRYPKITVQDISLMDEDSLYQIFNIQTEILELEGLTLQMYKNMHSGIVRRIRENTRNLQVAGNTDLYSYDGILYRTGPNGHLIAVVCPKERGGALTVKDGTTNIWSNAFAYCESLETLVLPDSVELISDSAFCGCEQLSKVSFGKGLRKIEAYAFDCCVGLEQIEIPEQVRSIQHRAFRGCKRLKKVVLRGMPAIQPLNFQYLEELQLPDTPPSFFQLKNMLYNIGQRSSNEMGANPFIKIKVRQQPWLYVPMELTELGLDIMTDLILARYGKAYVDTPEGLCFQFTRSIRAKQETAYAIYKDTKDANAAAYLKKIGKQMFLRKMKEAVPESDLLVFLREGFLSKAACNSLLPIVQQKQLPVLTAYLMNHVRKKQKAQQFGL